MNSEKTSKPNSYNQIPPNNHDDEHNSVMKILLDLIGYQYYTSRAAFEYQGSEIAFVNDGLSGRVRIYADGEQKVGRFVMCPTIRTDSSFDHSGSRFQVKSNCTGWFKSTQKISLWVDGVQVESKYDPGFSGLKWYQQAHFVGGALLMGMALGASIQLILELL